MGTLKDAVDLITDLVARIKDRKTREALLPIQEKIIEAQTENLELERSNFRLEKEHFNEMTDLKAAHSKEVNNLKSKIAELELKITEMSSKKGMQVLKMER